MPPELLNHQIAGPAAPARLEGDFPRTAPLPAAPARPMGYRGWSGSFRLPLLSVWPIARVGLKMMFRRKLFWAMYVLALFNFLVYFAGIYLFAQIDLEALTAGKATQQQIKMWTDVKTALQKNLKLTGDAETFRNFFWFQGYFVMAILALAGSTLIGNDYTQGSLPFYLSKPLSRWHYLGGKLLAVAVFILLLTTVPALVLFVECSLLEADYFNINWRLLSGLLGYGALLSVGLSLVIIALASWLRKTAPLIMVWLGLLVFARLLGNFLVDGLRQSPSWRLIDFWNVLYVLGSRCLGVAAELTSPERRMAGPSPPRLQPEVWQAALVFSIVVLACLIYLQRRIRAVEVVR